MKLPCHLRTIRGSRTLRSVAQVSGVNLAELSRIETGFSLPKDKDIESLERAYGASAVDWYPSRVLLCMEGDGDDLEAIRARMHLDTAHDEKYWR